MAFIPQPLHDVAAELNAGAPEARVSVRTLLRWFGSQRRGYYVVRTIRLALKELALVTEPNFENAWIDEKIGIRKADLVPVVAVIPAPVSPAIETETNLDGYLGGAILASNDPTNRIGKLDAANRSPKFVVPNSELSVAITIMLAHDYSQVPVISGKATVKGMVSWRSIGKARHFGKKIDSVMDCVEKPFEISEDVSLFAALPIIVEHEYVLVRSTNNEIKGIVTTADLSLQFRTLAEPFLLLGEAENHIRGMIDRCFPLDVIRSVKDPADIERQIDSASDLNFGEYARLLENPEHWTKLRLPLDRKVFVDILEEVRSVRNDVMHFDPDGVADADLASLRDFANLVRELASDKLI